MAAGSEAAIGKDGVRHAHAQERLQLQLHAPGSSQGRLQPSRVHDLRLQDPDECSPGDGGGEHERHLLVLRHPLVALGGCKGGCIGLGVGAGVVPCRWLPAPLLLPHGHPEPLVQPLQHVLLLLLLCHVPVQHAVIKAGVLQGASSPCAHSPKHWLQLRQHGGEGWDEGPLLGPMGRVEGGGGRALLLR